MQITTGILIAGTGCRPTVASVWLNSLQLACDKYGINSPNAMASFLANVGVESAGLVRLSENLDYSAQGLANTWPNRYATNRGSRPLIPNALAIALAHNPQKIANNVYANRLGNGNEASGDGWHCRGQGPIQITGKAEIARCGEAIGVDLVANPALLQTPTVGALSAAWYFADAGCIQAAEDGNFPLVVKLINGKFPDDANEGPLREARRKAAMAAITARQSSGVAQPVQDDAAE